MNGFSVVPPELTDAAQRLREQAGELTDGPVSAYGVNPAQMGNERMALVIDELQDASRYAIALLSETANRAADRLCDTADAYVALDTGDR